MRFKQDILICVVFVELDLPQKPFFTSTNGDQKNTKEKDPCMKVSGKDYLFKDSFVVDLLPSDLHEIRSSVPAKCISAKRPTKRCSRPQKVVDPYGPSKISKP